MPELNQQMNSNGQVSIGARPGRLVKSSAPQDSAQNGEEPVERQDLEEASGLRAGLSRTKALFSAAFRLWELKNGIRD